MCSYVANWENDTLKYQNPCVKLMEISDDSLYIKTFDYPRIETKDEVHVFNYTYDNSMLYFGDDSLIFSSTSKDSLVIQSNWDQNRVTVFKRLPELSSPPVNFEEDFYELTCNDYVDSFQIINQELLIHQNEKWSHDGERDPWYISEYKNYKFLVIKRWSGLFAESPLLITESDESKIGIRLFDLHVIDGTIRKVKIGRKPIEISGTWVQNSPLKYWKLFFPYVMGNPKEDFKKYNHLDTLAKITIDSDSLSISQYNLSRKYKYWTSISGSHLIIELPDSLSEYDYWHMQRLNDSTLQIYNYLPGWFTQGKERVLFKIENER